MSFYKKIIISIIIILIMVVAGIFMPIINKKIPIQPQTQIDKEIKVLQDKKVEKEKLLSELKSVDEYISKVQSDIEKYGIEFKITAYDLSIDSCGKPIGSREYGETFTGFNLRGLDRKSAKVVATDPRVIPLGSRIFIKFDDKSYSQYDGIYYSSDIGGKVKDRKVDLFLGDFNNNKESKIVKDFGITRAKILILR